jgi:polyisoprenoid-binding protein YceI
LSEIAAMKKIPHCRELTAMSKGIISSDSGFFNIRRIFIMAIKQTSRAKTTAIFGAAITATALILSPLAFSLGGVPATAAPAVSAAAATGTWGVDKTHTDIGFTIKHLAVSKVRGHFNDFDGTVVVNGAKPESSSVNFTIKAASIDTANAQRDGHLKSADFFDVDKYPEIAFKSTKITKTKKGFNATGQFTMHGVTKTIVLPFTVEGPIKGPDGALHLGVDTAVTLNRQDYGLTWSKMTEGVAMVSNEVDIAISLDLAKKA